MSHFLDRLRTTIPPVTRNLMMITLIVWLAQMALPLVGIDFTNLFGLHYFQASSFRLWQLVSYMFLHAPGQIAHIFWNMFALFMFGIHIERLWGGKRFLIFYLVCGLTAALSQELMWFWKLSALSKAYETISISGAAPIPMATYLNLFITVGASGSVFGILLAFGMMFPNVPLYFLFIPIPIKAKYMVVFYGLVELFLGVAGSNDGVAHFAHLGGMLGGLILILWWRKRRPTTYQTWYYE